MAALRMRRLCLCLLIVATVTSQDHHDVAKTRRKRQQSFNANDLIGLLSNLASQSGVGGGGGGIGANLLQQFQQSPGNGGGQQGAIGGIASSLAQFLAGLSGQGLPEQGQYPQQNDGSFGIYANQGQYPGGGQQQYPGQFGGQRPGQFGGGGGYQGQQGQYPGQQGQYPGRPYPGGYGQYPGRPGVNPGYGHYPGGPGSGIYPGQGGPGYAPNPGGAASFTEALTSIAQYDDLRCVPRLLCEVASGGRPDYSYGKQDSVFPFVSKDALLTLLTVFNFADTSPLFAFGRAALLGVTARGNPKSCYSAYPTCPSDPDTLVNYLNNHNGGFFRFFNNRQQQQQQHQQYAPQYTNQYGQNGQRYGYQGGNGQYNPQKGQKFGLQGGQQYYQNLNGALQGYYGQNGAQGGQKYGSQNGQNFFGQQNGVNAQKGQKYGLQQQAAQQYYGQQYPQYAQQYQGGNYPQRYYQGGYGQQRIQNTKESASNQVEVTNKPYKQTTGYESFPPYAEKYVTTPKYEVLASQYEYNGDSGRPKGVPLRFPRSEEETVAESRIVYDHTGQGNSGHGSYKTRYPKGFSFPSSSYGVVPTPAMVFPDRTGTGDLRLDTDDYGKTIIFSVSDTVFTHDRYKSQDDPYFGKGTKFFKFPNENGFRKQRGSKSLMKFPSGGRPNYERDTRWSNELVRFPNRYEDKYSRSLGSEDEGILAEPGEDEKGSEEKSESVEDAKSLES